MIYAILIYPKFISRRRFVELYQRADGVSVGAGLAAPMPGDPKGRAFFEINSQKPSLYFTVRVFLLSTFIVLDRL